MPPYTELVLRPPPVQAETVQGARYNIVTEFTLRILGLDYVADTVVGGSMLRGISGGQKKRVTTGEMIVGCDVLDCTPHNILSLEDV